MDPRQSGGANQVGLGLIDEIRSYLEGLPDRELAETLIGGLSTYEFPEQIGGETLKLIPMRPASPNTFCRRCRTHSTRATPPAGSTAG